MEFSSSLILSDKTVHSLLKWFEPKTKELKKGETILQKDTPDSRLLLLLKGTSYLCVENKYGGRQLLDFFFKGQILFHEMLPAADSGHCYLYAKYPCTVACLDRHDLMAYLYGNPSSGLAELLFDLLFSMTAARNEHCHILQQKTIRGKLLAFLHEQVIRQENTLVRIPVPYSDLADYLAIDRSSLMTELSRMHADGVIEKRGRDIRVN
ncbi:Crp/Fnr family transcriptional regulator [Lachnospiraceae bacterium JLR.KK008]